MTDTLRDQLSALADQARSADLYDRVIAGSRKRARRVRAAGTASAVVALAAVVFGVTQIRTDGAPLEIGPSAVNPSPSVAASAASPSSPPSTPPAGGQPSMELSNASLEIIIPVGRGVCRFTDGIGTVEINTTYDARLISSAVFTERGIAAALIEIQAGNGSPLRQIHLYRLPETTTGAVLLDKQLAEFLFATKIEAVGDELQVTIEGKLKRYKIEI